MKFYFINTDWRARQDAITCDLWFKYKMAFTGDYGEQNFKYSNIFRKLQVGDILFMYHSKGDTRNHKKKGYVGIGKVLETWDGNYYQSDDRILYEKETYEYRIAVKWFVDWREMPKDHKEIGLPITSATWGRIDEKKYPVKSLLKDLIS